MDGIKNFFSGHEGRKRLTSLFGFTATSIGLVYGFRVVSPVAQTYLKRKFFAPKLISRSIRQYPGYRLFNKPKNVDMVIPETVREKMDGIISATRNTSTRGGYFGHLMLHGAVCNSFLSKLKGNSFSFTVQLNKNANFWCKLII